MPARSCLQHGTRAHGVTNGPEAFAVATDAVIARLISDARRRLVVAAPALSKEVAGAVAERCRALPPDEVALIVESDPEVYRLGLDDIEGLTVVSDAVDPITMGRTTGGTIPAQIWADTMRVAHQGVEPHPLPGYEQPVRSPEEMEIASFFDTLAREFGESDIVEDLTDIFN